MVNLILPQVQGISDIQVCDIFGELVVDSRLIAKGLGIQHEFWEHLVTNALDEFPDFLSAWDLLAVVRYSSLTAGEVEGLLGLVDSIFYPSFSQKEKCTFSWLKLSVIEGLAKDILCRGSEEGKVHDWFRNNFLNYFPGSKFRKVIATNGKRPDFLIEIDDKIIPVECKLTFGVSALQQLKGYMKIWGVDKGVAVAPRFTTKLPQNIVQVTCT